MGKKKAAPKPASDKSAMIPAKYLKPYVETPLAAAFTVEAKGAMPIGAGLTGNAMAAMANVMQRLGYTTVEEVLSVLQTAKRELVRQFKLPAEIVDAFARLLAPHAKPIPDEVRSVIAAQKLSFGFALGEGHRSDRGPTSVALLTPLQTPTVAASDSAIGFALGGVLGAAGTTGGGALGGAGSAIGAALGGAGSVIGAAPPSRVNLISELPNPVRNQGDRGTCVPHSTLVAYEHYLATKTGTPVDLSEQFLFFACKRRDRIPMPQAAEGTTMRAAVESLEEEGVCEENDWPYNPNNAMDLAGNPGQGPPPAGAADAAAAFRPAEIIQVTATMVDEYKRVLASGRCASFAVPVYASSFRTQIPEVQVRFASGRIVLPIGNEAPIGGHAMCIVGYEDDPTAVPALGGGRFIIRNSYGTAFGALSPHGPGHGTIPYAYIAAAGRELGIAFM